MGRVNPKLGAELSRTPAFAKALGYHGERVRSRAERFANQFMPRRKGFSGSQVKVVVGADRSVIVANFNHGGHLDEFGSANNPPYAPLRRAATAAGLRFHT